MNGTGQSCDATQPRAVGETRLESHQVEKVHKEQAARGKHSGERRPRLARAAPASEVARPVGIEAAAPVDRVELYVERGGEHGWDSAVKPRCACVLGRPEAHAGYVAASGKPLEDNPVRIEVAWPHRR